MENRQRKRIRIHLLCETEWEVCETPFPKPYPPTPIDYEDWNILIDALEARFGPSASGFIRDRTRIVNSRGNIWEKAAGNVQQAIEDVLADDGGGVWLPKGRITET